MRYRTIVTGLTSRPWFIDLSPDGQRLFLEFQNSTQEVQYTGLFSFHPGTFIPCGNPGIALTALQELTEKGLVAADHNRTALWVCNWLDWNKAPDQDKKLIGAVNEARYFWQSQGSEDWRGLVLLWLDELTRKNERIRSWLKNRSLIGDENADFLRRIRGNIEPITERISSDDINEILGG